VSIFGTGRSFLPIQINFLETSIIIREGSTAEEIASKAPNDFSTRLNKVDFRLRS